MSHRNRIKNNDKIGRFPVVYVGSKSRDLSTCLERSSGFVRGVISAQAHPGFLGRGCPGNENTVGKATEMEQHNYRQDCEEKGQEWGKWVETAFQKPQNLLQARQCVTDMHSVPCPSPCFHLCWAEVMGHFLCCVLGLEKSSWEKGSSFLGGATRLQQGVV